jgi:hypothetical protein
VLPFISGATAAGLNERARLCKKRRAAIGVPINVLRFIPAASPRKEQRTLRKEHLRST